MGDREDDLDDELRRELEEMWAADQAIREKAMAVVREHGTSSPEYRALLEQGRAMDRRHAARLIAIVEAHGWPGTSRVGRDAAHGAFLALQHADLATQERLLPLLREATAAGEAASTDLPLLEDRVRMLNGANQIYGTQIARGPDGTARLWPVQNMEHLDERRAAAGLEPLDAYLQRFGLDDPRGPGAGG